MFLFIHLMTHDCRRVHSSSTVPPVAYRDALHCASRVGHNGYTQMKSSFLGTHASLPYSSSLACLYKQLESMAQDAYAEALDLVPDQFMSQFAERFQRRPRAQSQHALI